MVTNKKRHHTTYLDNDAYHKYTVVEDMTNSEEYAPELCLAVYEALERLNEKTDESSADYEDLRLLLQESAEYSVGSWYDDDIYSMGSQAEEYLQQAIDEEILRLHVDERITIADMIRAGLVVLIREKALEQVTGCTEGKLRQ